MTIVSIDFDAFYVGCHRSVDPSVRGIPFAVQQKHILCTGEQRPIITFLT